MIKDRSIILEEEKPPPFDPRWYPTTKGRITRAQSVHLKEGKGYLLTYSLTFLLTSLHQVGRRLDRF